MAKYKKLGRRLTHHNDFFQIRKKQFEEEGRGEGFKKQQALLKTALAMQQTITENDVKLWDKFREIVLTEKQNSPDGRVFFKWHHVIQLGVPFDIVFIYGAKNIGKTVATSEFVTEILKDPDQKVMLLRNTRSELDKGFAAQLEEEKWPFTYVQQGSKLKRKKGYLPERGPYTKAKRGQHKKAIEEDELTDTDAWKAKNDPNHCGWATCLTGMGLRSFQGPSYPGLSHVFWDECNDVGDISSEDLRAFLVFILSLERTKKKFNIWLVGNLLRQKDGTASNIFMDHFGIPYDCNLKYFTTQGGIRFLYINPGEAGDLYSGTKDQKYTDMVGGSVAEDMLNNSPEAYSVKVLNRALFFESTNPMWSFLAMHEQKYYILYIGAYDDRPDGYKYVLRIETFNKAYHHYGYVPITDSVVAANQFGNLVYKKKRHVGKIIKKLFKIQKKKLLYFADDETRRDFTEKLYDRLLSRYSEEIGDIL